MSVWSRFADCSNDDAFIALVRQSASEALCDNAVVADTNPTAATSEIRLAVSHRYDLIQQIASGGMGLIWIAHDGLLDRKVAIKVLRQSPRPGSDSGQPLLYDRFVRESKIVSSLQHPGIPPVYDLGILDSGKPFLAMKLVSGKTLAERLEDEDVPSIDWLLEVFAQVCQTLAFAHSRGVVHRDLKPENIMVGQFGETQVMDWGISEFSGQAENEDLCESNAILGTPAYMSPEQANGRPCGPRADVFSLGSLLCELLTGAPAYQGENANELMAHAAAGNVQEAISRLGRCNADPTMIALAQSCLAKDSADRPADAAEVAKRVAEHLHSVQARLRAAELERAKSLARSIELARRRRTQRWLAVSAACLAAVSLFAWQAHRQRAQEAGAQVNAAIDEARGLIAKAGAASEGGRAHLESALRAAERAVRISAETNDPSSQQGARKLRAQLVRQITRAARIEQLQVDLRNAMVFESGRTVEQRYRNKQEMLRRAVDEGRRSTLLFLEFPSRGRGPGSARDRRPRGPQGRPNQPIASEQRPEHEYMYRTNGRVRAPSFEDFISGKVNVFRYAEVQHREYERAFTEFGLTSEISIDDAAAMLAEHKSSDRELITSGLRMWFLFAADTRSEAVSWLDKLLDRVNEDFGSSDNAANWSRHARNAIRARDGDAITAQCDAARPIMAELTPELLWGLGSFQLRFSRDSKNDWFLRHAQRHFLDSFLLNRELARLETHRRRAMEAAPYITSALAVYTDHDLSIQLARNLITTGKIDEYEIVRDQCFAQYPNDPIMLAEWADLMAMHRRPEVFVTFERALDAGFPEPQVLLARMGQLYQRNGADDLARWMYEDALQVEDLPGDHEAELKQALASMTSEGGS